ncbi:GAF domain-containing protein [Haloplanus pelagicus]|jgi:GAF domain-containing protein|uniref:GAF domain-containing protein n=1 Tax=Haloplanus pelagicus TaxID=2949995 RepID=UPI00203B7048|nr:GAF domain-containing protein [Haloplanus sp. HW8-1]
MRVLCVDPASDEGHATQSALSRVGIDATVCGSLHEARETLDESVVGVVTEYDLPDGTGLELVDEVRTVVPDATCVLFTDAGFDELETAALGTTVAEYVDKGLPDAREELVDLLSFGIDNRSQTAYPLPRDEVARLDAVEEYVDDPSALDTSLDRLTTVAAALFDVDSATVGFLEAHEERFVACHGTDVDSLAREDTICTYTVLDDGVTVVPDTREDPRFETNDELVAADIRFYAGAPIRTDEGDAIGVFCLFDAEPRAFGDEDRTLLSTLADDVMDRLDLRRRLREATAGDRDE